jgi:Uma2 family endonuclease
MGTKALVTMEQFLQLPDDESYRYELWQGELVDVGETTIRHNWVRDRLIFLISCFLERTKLGMVFAETGVQFDSNTLARPDVVYWDAAHFATIEWDRSPIQIVPQLVAEVASPSNSLNRLFRNAEYFLRAGVQVVWVVETASRLKFTYSNRESPSAWFDRVRCWKLLRFSQDFQQRSRASFLPVGKTKTRPALVKQRGPSQVQD